MDHSDQPLKQPNELTVLIPKVGKLSGVGRKLHVSLMRSAQFQLRALQSEERTLKATEFFKAPLSEIIKPISKPGSNLIAVAKDYVDQMQSTKVEWTAPEGTKEGVLWDQMVLITQAKISLENGRLWLYWGFPQDIVSVLSDPTADYTLTRPEDLKELSGYAAISLYIIASRYKNNPSHATCIRPTSWWIEALRGNSSRKSPKDKSEAKLPIWRKFKSERVMPAIDEINSKSPLYIELIEIREGQAVKDVQFKVWQKSQFRPSDPVSTLHIQAAALGIPKEEITNHLKNGRTESELQVELAKLSARKENARLDPVKNALQLFRANMRAPETIQVKAKRIDKPKTTKAAQRTLFETIEQSETVGYVPLIPAQSAPSPLDLIFEELLEQPPHISDELLNQVRNDLMSRNMLTPVLSKRINEKNWRSGMLRFLVVEAYATKTYGDDWKEAIETKIARQKR